MFSTRRKTYRSFTTTTLVAAVTVDKTWWSMGGSSSKRVRLQRITLFAPTLTAAELLRIKLVRNVCTSVNTTNGTGPFAMVAVPVENGNGATTLGFHRTNTVADTVLAAGVASNVAFLKHLALTTALAATDSRLNAVFDFKNMDEAQQPTLDGLLQEFHLQWATAPASAVTMDIEVEWIEEG